MTHKFTKTLLRGMCLAALAGIGLVATPGTARADFITFTVAEGAVPGTPTNTFQADKLNGGFVANLSLAPVADPTTCGAGNTACGTWSETATSTFSAYYLAPSTVAITPAFIGDNEPNGYVILGNLVSGGSYVTTTCGPNVCDIFTFTSQTGTLTLDSDSNGVGDTLLLTATGVAPGSSGQLTFLPGPTGGNGFFNSNFLTSTLAPGIAQAYWPTLAAIQFQTTINGDTDSLNTFPVIRGDVSVQFSQVPQVPEPATLSLLSLGLAAGARAIRRRRAGNA